ncbi:hypothetical protein GCM10023220_55990 [Streptomyces ziwulingensis]|uniref:Uncharacterized protein n=1 Tax=Streptomyces ziwulingensis TaxID=1045501 RepID=A0ABP9CRY1_9ACTN
MGGEKAKPGSEGTITVKASAARPPYWDGVPGRSARPVNSGNELGPRRRYRLPAVLGCGWGAGVAVGVVVAVAVAVAVGVGVAAAVGAGRRGRLIEPASPAGGPTTPSATRAARTPG